MTDGTGAPDDAPVPRDPDLPPELAAALPAETPSGWRLVRRAAPLAVTGLCLYLLAPTLVEVLRSAPRVIEIQPAWLLAIVALESASFVCTWMMQRLALRTRRWFAIATSQLAGNALSRVVPGGPAAGAALQYRMLAQARVDTTRAASALAATSLLQITSVLSLPAIALLAILAGTPVDPSLSQAAWLGTFVFVGVVAFVAVLAIFDPAVRVLGRVAQWTANRLRRRRAPVEDLPQRLLAERDHILDAFGERWWEVLLATFGRLAFDYLALLAALAAVNARPNPFLILLAYGASMALALIPVTPGGLGFVEAGLTATLTLAGVSPANAVFATLLYRLASYWLPLAAGPVAYGLHSHRYRARAATP